MDDIQIGMLGQHLHRNSVVSLPVIAEAVHMRKREEQAAGRFVYDRLSHTGSSNFATLMDPDGQSKECILWTINHYLGLNRHPDVLQAARKAIDTYGIGCE